MKRPHLKAKVIARAALFWVLLALTAAASVFLLNLKIGEASEGFVVENQEKERSEQSQGETEFA